jgi:hypothetical protein
VTSPEESLKPPPQRAQVAGQEAEGGKPTGKQEDRNKPRSSSSSEFVPNFDPDFLAKINANIRLNNERQEQPEDQESDGYQDGDMNYNEPPQYHYEGNEEVEEQASDEEENYYQNHELWDGQGEPAQDDQIFAEADQNSQEQQQEQFNPEEFMQQQLQQAAVAFGDEGCVPGSELITAEMAQQVMMQVSNGDKQPDQEQLLSYLGQMVIQKLQDTNQPEPNSHEKGQSEEESKQNASEPGSDASSLNKMKMLQSIQQKLRAIGGSQQVQQLPP